MSSSSEEIDFFNNNPDVSYLGKTLSGTYVIVYQNSLYYQKFGQGIVKYADDIQKVSVYKNLVVVLYTPTSAALSLVILKENFSDTETVFVKDNAFDIDDIDKYLDFSNRTIRDFHISDGELFVIFNNQYGDLSSSSVSMSSISSESDSSNSPSSQSLSSPSSNSLSSPSSVSPQSPSSFSSVSSFSSISSNPSSESSASAPVCPSDISGSFAYDLTSSACPPCSYNHTQGATGSITIAPDAGTDECCYMVTVNMTMAVDGDPYCSPYQAALIAQIYGNIKPTGCGDNPVSLIEAVVQNPGGTAGTYFHTFTFWTCGKNSFNIATDNDCSGNTHTSGTWTATKVSDICVGHPSSSSHSSDSSLSSESSLSSDSSLSSQSVTLTCNLGSGGGNSISWQGNSTENCSTTYQSTNYLPVEGLGPLTNCCYRVDYNVDITVDEASSSSLSNPNCPFAGVTFYAQTDSGNLSQYSCQDPFPSSTDQAWSPNNGIVIPGGDSLPAEGTMSNTFYMCGNSQFYFTLQGDLGFTTNATVNWTLTYLGPCVGSSSSESSTSDSSVSPTSQSSISISDSSQSPSSTSISVSYSSLSGDLGNMVIAAGISCGAAGSITGLSNPQDNCCDGSTVPIEGSTYGHTAYDEQANTSDLTATVTINITCADPTCSGPCGGIDPSTFPTCGFIVAGFISGPQQSIAIDTFAPQTITKTITVHTDGHITIT